MPKQPQSPLAGKATNLIKAADKLVRDTRRDVASLLRALRELKGDIGGKEDGKGSDTKH